MKAKYESESIMYKFDADASETLTTNEIHAMF